MASNYLKALQLTKQLEKKAQEATHNRKLAEKEIASAEENISEAKKMDANVAKAEAKLTEATAALSQKDFKLALELAQESKTIAQKTQETHVAMVMESTKNLVNLAKNLGAEVPDLDESLQRADNAIKEGKFHEALIIAEKGWEGIDKLLNEKVSEAFTKAQSLIIMTKKLGQDVNETENLLNKAREYTEKNEYEKALGFINESNRLASKMAKEEISKGIENAMVSLDLAKKMDIDVKNVEEIYIKAKKATDEGEFEKAQNLANKCINETEKLIEKQSKNLVTQCEVSIKQAKTINAEITKASLLFNRAKEALKSKNFEEVYDCSSQIQEEVENAQFQSVLKTISLSRPKFIAAKNIGADLTEPMKFLDMARNSLKNKQFVEALEYARKGENHVNKLISDYDGAKEELQLITQAFSRASKIGVDTKTISASIKEAKTAFDAKDYKKARTLISQCREKIEKGMSEQSLEVVKISEEVISIGEKTGADVKKAKEYIKQAVVAIEENNYEKGIELAQKGKDEAADGIKIGINEEIKNLSEILNDLIEGEEKNKCTKALSRAKETLASGNYEGAYGFIVNFKNILDEQIKISMDFGKNTVKVLRDMKGESKSAEKMMSELESLMNQKKYSETLSLSEKLMKETNAQQSKVTSDILTSLSDDIEDAKSLGVNVKDQETSLAEAKEAIKKKQFKKAYSIITKSKEELNLFVNNHKELSEALNSLKFQIEEARKKGIDMSSAIKRMEAAKKALVKQNFDAVSNKIKECESDIKQLTVVHSIKEKINQSKECMNVAKTLEMDISDVEMQLKKTVIYLNNGQLEDALGSADKTLDKAKELCTLKISDMLTNGYSMIIEAKKIGLDVLTVEVLYQKAEEALDQERYEKAAKYASQSLGEIEEIRDESQRAANIIHLAGNYIQDAENINADVNDAKKLLEKAFSELKNNEYIASIELGKKCIRGAKKAKEMRVGEVIKSFQSIIDSSKKEGMNVSKAEFLLEEAKIALGDEDYSEALRLAMMSESEVEKVDLQKKMANEIISVTVEKLKGAEKIGVGVENIKTLLKNASNSLQKKDYVKALEYSMEAGMELSEATEEFERAATTIHAARARINESDEIGVNVKKAKELFETAKKAFNEREYSTAMKFAKETIREAKRAYVSHLSRPIDECDQLNKTASEIGINVQRANNMLSEAKAALEEESYSQVALFTDNCQRLMEREITKYLFDQLSSAKSKLKKTKGKGEDVKEATGILRSVESALENRKYSDAADNFKKYLEKFEGVKKVEPDIEKMKEEKKLEEKKPEERKIDLDKFIPILEGKIHYISKLGISTKEAEKLIKKAKDNQKKQPDLALKIAQDAENALENELESFSPKISTEIDLSGVKKKDEWYEIPLIVINAGKSVAKDVSITQKSGNFEVQGLDVIKIMKAKEKKEIPIKIKATTEGKLKMLFEIKFLRIFDNKEIITELSKEIDLKGEPSIGAHKFTKIKAEKPVRCYACNGKIKPGLIMIQCKCGTVYHETCGQRIGKCPMCGVDFKKDN